MALRTRPLNAILLSVVVFLLMILLYSQSGDNALSKQDRLKTKVELFEKWNECMKKRVRDEDNFDKFWANFQQWSSDCDTRAEIDRLNLISLQNTDEVKYGMLPVEGDINTPNVLVTLGIGKDIDAEQVFMKKMNSIGRNLTFYGADPITDINADLYAKIGKYFPFAVGGDAGYSRASVLINGTYLFKDVVHVDLIYFLDRILKMKTYDHIWLDAEFAEYDLFDVFYRNGRLDEKDIKFCQMSLEVHEPNAVQKSSFMLFIKQMIEDKRYGFFKNLNVGHMRMYLFNFDEPYCVRKFVPRRLYELEDN